MKGVWGSVGWYIGKLNTALKAASSEEEELFEGEKSSEAEAVDMRKNVVVHTRPGNVRHHSTDMGASSTQFQVQKETQKSS